MWNPHEGSIYWLDIVEKHVQRFHPPTGKHEIFELDRRITALAFRESGGLVTATDRGFAFWDLETGEFEPISDPEPNLGTNRLNDAAVDPQGRFWAGTMNEQAAEQPDGSLYRMDADLSVHKMDSGFTVSNGTGWSPDGRIMYFTDSLRRCVFAYDYDVASGSIENRRVFAEFPEEGGAPDGLTVDSEGFVWSALWPGWRVARLDPDGKEERDVKLPQPVASSCCFGGENLDELYITSAGSDEDRKEHPGTGDLFRAHVGIVGQVEPKFAG